ncbi:MAG: tryptophan synthase beta chain, partial [Stygiobacter sp.]
GAGAIVSQLLKDKLIEAQAVKQLECFEAGVQFANAEGILPAPEATHGLAVVKREVEQARKEGKSKIILFNLCGHGYFDMSAYQQYFEGKIVDHEMTDEEIANLISKIDTPEIV